MHDWLPPCIFFSSSFWQKLDSKKKKEKCVAVTGPHKKYNPNCSAACWCFHLELETTRTVGAGSSDRSLEGTWLQPTSAVVPELFGLQRSLKV
jgi:hypothetical protein